MVKKMKLYLETSVLGFLFADDAPEKMKITKRFFETAFRNNDIFISELVIEEVERASGHIKTRLLGIMAKYKLKAVKITDEAEKLAKIYVENKIIPPKYFNDALHIALTSVNKMDAIVSWNLEHIVKLKTMVGIREINKRLGYKDILIITPEEVL